MERTDIFDFDFVDFVMNFAEMHHMPSGAALFTVIPSRGNHVLIGKPWNPFIETMTRADVMYWIENHLIFDGNGMVIKIFDGDKILWEK